MKKAVMLAAALSVIGGSAMASSYGSFGSFRDGYKRDYQKEWSFSREDFRERLSRYSGLFNFDGKLDFCGCGDYWSKDCHDDGGKIPDDTSEVPLPAAGFLLLGALGGIATLKRRKK